MKAITLIQPWATLIALGEKRIETRSWYTGYRGPIAIHAGKKPPVDIGCEQYDRALERHALSPERLPLGAVIATATLKDCVRFADDTAWIVEEYCELPHGQFPYQVGPDEWCYGDFSGDRYGFVLTDVIALPKPVPARGLQGLWNWDGEA